MPEQPTRPNKKSVPPKTSRVSKKNISLNDLMTKIIKENKNLDLAGVLKQDVSPEDVIYLENKLNIKKNSKGNITKSIGKNMRKKDVEMGVFDHFMAYFLGDSFIRGAKHNKKSGYNKIKELFTRRKGDSVNPEAIAKNETPTEQANEIQPEFKRGDNEEVIEKLDNIYDIQTEVKNKVELNSNQIEKLGQKSDDILEKITQVYDRISPSEIVFGKGENEKKYHYDPLAPQGKQVKQINNNGKVSGFVNAGDMNRVLTAASYLGSKKPKKVSDDVKPSDPVEKEEQKIERVQNTTSTQSSINQPSVNRKVDLILRIVATMNKRATETITKKKTEYTEQNEKKSGKKKPEELSFAEHFLAHFIGEGRMHQMKGNKKSGYNMIKKIFTRNSAGTPTATPKKDDIKGKSNKVNITPMPEEAPIAGAVEGAAAPAAAGEGLSIGGLLKSIPGAGLISGIAGAASLAAPVLGVGAAAAGGYAAGSYLNEKLGISDKIDDALEDKSVSKEARTEQDKQSNIKAKADIAKRLEGTGYELVGPGKYKDSSGNVVSKSELPPDVQAKLPGDVQSPVTKNSDTVTPKSTPTETASPTSDGISQKIIPKSNAVVSMDQNATNMEESSGEDINSRLDDIEKSIAMSSRAILSVAGQKSPPMVISSGTPAVVLKIRNDEPSIATYNASIFDHPVVHPGIYKM